MADGNERLRNNPSTPLSNADSDLENTVQPLQPDLGNDLTSETNRLGFQNAGPSGTGSTDFPRREDNPFSFKHFLYSDNNYQHRGARPKVYCDGRQITSVSDLEVPNFQETTAKQTRIVPEYSSALPDFVQDHLVIEQCYLGNPSSNVNLDLNLPDFTPSRDNVNERTCHNNRRGDEDNFPMPLGGFPLDLPVNSHNTNSPQEVGVSKSLPDFLADSAVRTQNSVVSPSESPIRENERLRRDLEEARFQLSEQMHRADMLARELEVARNKEHDYTQNLAKALEHVEENLERSNMRTASAENTITKLKQEINSLVRQLNNLKAENRALRGEEGAAGGHEQYSSPSELHSQRLAQELKAAASTAEHSLRQLLTGVDNLRIMAATLENMHRIEEKREPFLDFDEDTGPAL